MGCLEIKWGNTHITLNNKEIHLPTTLLIPLVHKIKVRKLFNKINLMHVYIMLKQQKSWYNLECAHGITLHSEVHTQKIYSPVFLLQSSLVFTHLYL